MPAERKRVETLEDALQLVEFGGVADSARGLSEAKRILDRNRHSRALAEFTDRTIHHLYEVLFQFVRQERAAYVKTLKPKVKQDAAERLGSAAETFRVAVETTVQSIKRKTLEAAVVHVVDSLVLEDEGLCVPLRVDYLRALNAILEYGPHAEHLSHPGIWHTVVDFCLDAIENFSNRAEDPERVSQALLRKSPGLSQTFAELLRGCALLGSVTNCPLSEKAERLCSVILTFLKTARDATEADASNALRSINAVLSRIACHSGSLIFSVVLEIVPLVRKLWRDGRESALRDEVLVSLVHTKSHMIQLLETEDSQSFRDDVEGLLEVLRHDYVSRSRGHLDITELCLGQGDRPRQKLMPMQTESFWLRRADLRSEHNWTVVHFVAFSAAWIDLYDARWHQPRPALDDNDSSKRRRVASHFDDLLSSAIAADGDERLHLLQLAAFSVQHKLISLEKLTRTIEAFRILANSKDNQSSSWALLGLAACTLQPESTSSALRPIWLIVWQLAYRLISSIHHCKSACHLLCALLKNNCVAFPDVAETIDSMFISSGLNGPVLLCDSAVAMWVIMTRFKAEIHPATATSAYEQMLSWLFSKWNLSNFENRPYARQLAAEVSGADLSHIFASVMGDPWCKKDPMLAAPLGPIGRAWLQRYLSRDLTTYLLLLQANSKLSPEWSVPAISDADSPPGPLQRSGKLEQQALTFFASTLDKTSDIWTTVMQDRRSAVNGDMTFVLSSFCIVASICVNCLESNQASLAREVAAKLRNFWTAIVKFARQDDTKLEVLDGISAAVAPFLPDLSPGTTLEDVCETGKKLQLIWTADLARSLREREAAQSSQVVGEDWPEDSLDPGHGTQLNAAASDYSRSPRSNLEVQSCQSGYTASILSYVGFLSRIADLKAANAASSDNLSIFLTEMGQLQADQFLLCGIMIGALVTTCGKYVTASTTIQLLDYIGEGILGTYALERCETALCLTIDFLTATVSLWTNNKLTSLFDTGADIYEWVIDVAFKPGMCSDEVHIAMSNLLYKLLEAAPDYCPTSSGRSVRTLLFDLLEIGALPVQHHIASRLPEVFEKFVLSQHDAIFLDILEKLPKNADQLEGIAIRLLVLTRIGCTWKTLLRRCLYHIFETPGMVPSANAHATKCIYLIAEKFKLADGKSLFRLFSSQLLFSWLEEQSLSTIPFAIFGYGDLRQLLVDVKDEFVSQLVMRPDDEMLKEAETLLGSSSKELLQASFPQAAAYAFGKDISTPAQRPGGIPHDSEAKVREILGKSTYVVFVRKSFARIVGQLFLRLEQEDHVEKTFAKRQGYESAAATLKAIKSVSCSEGVLPASQQPSFKSRHLLDEIERLCRRTNTESSSMWTPAVILTVARLLASDMHMVLGSLHSCRVIQRMRILVCLSGSNALRGYPLQVLIQALRPLVVDKHCADDAIGLLQYVLSHGKDDLVNSPGFLGGTVLVIILSIRTFLKTKQDSTTQDSQHKATLGKAERFHRWLCQYIDALQLTPKLRQLLVDAREVKVVGSAVRNSAEAKLLLGLLEDCQSEKPMVAEPFFSLCLKSLCEHFTRPDSYQSDILGEGVEAAKYAHALWKTLISPVVHPDYVQWGLRALGRGIAERGELPPHLVVESGLQRLWNKDAASDSTSTLHSKKSIITTLLSFLMSEASTEAGLIEQSLRQITAHFPDSEDAGLIQTYLPRPISTALAGTDLQESLSPGAKEDEHNFADVVSAQQTSFAAWTGELLSFFAAHAPRDELLQILSTLIGTISELSAHLLPFVTHICLSRHYENGDAMQKSIGSALELCFQQKALSQDQSRTLLDIILYLRTQSVPCEQAPIDRKKWLPIDIQIVAATARDCGLSKTAVLLLEWSQSSTTDEIRSGPPAKQAVPDDLLLSIYSSIDEPDSFYGVNDSANLESLASRFEFEGNGMQSLLLRGAQSDSLMRRSGLDSKSLTSGLLQSLTTLNLNSLTHKLAMSQSSWIKDSAVKDNVLRSALKLRQWDIPVPASNLSVSSVMYRTFRSLSNLTTNSSPVLIIDEGMKGIFDRIASSESRGKDLHESLRALAALTEMDEVLACPGPLHLEEVQMRLYQRGAQLNDSSFGDVSIILSTREALFGLLSIDDRLRGRMQLQERHCRHMEAILNLQASKIYRGLGRLQEALSTSTYLVDIADTCKGVGVNIKDAVQFEAAHVLWDRDDIGPAISLLENLSQNIDTQKQALPLSKASVLVALGHRLGIARLQTPDKVIGSYLAPALEMLSHAQNGLEAGEAFHVFASYCHDQLHDPHNVDELARASKFKTQRENELSELDELHRNAKRDKEKSKAKSARDSAKKWFDLDNQEYIRLRETRESSLCQSLEGYLSALAFTDHHDTDVLRFVALWLANVDEPAANATVRKHITKVASHKVASLMNQLASRLQDTNDDFQTILHTLIGRICTEHPHHGMHHVFAGRKAADGNDGPAISRGAAAVSIAAKLQSNAATNKYWEAIYKSDDLLNRMAKFKPEEIRQGAKVTMDMFEPTKKVKREIPGLRVPPVTMFVPIRPDLDYSKTPYITSFRDQITIPSGISAPKIVVARMSDDSRHTGLYKGGTDDLRQDAIMEQVFGQVTDLLKTNKATMQRALRIRTYKVVPLDATSGAIEFCQPTMSLDEFLKKAHERYRPKDLKWDTCRKQIQNKQELPAKARIEGYVQVVGRFQPVMRHFFFERYLDPDEWFARRLAYTRSTAAISILGHVLGLGDRHCQNILIDTDTGEVIHIDLGVAFEAGRVLRIPETVPFRLTRDVVDGFGILGTEGVFRRCCEFTLEALRENKDAILTLLNVLRYDPLHNWTVSPLRAKRLQDEQQRGQAAAAAAAAAAANASAAPRSAATRLRRGSGSNANTAADADKAVNKSRSMGEEGGEADRALGVVEQKLSAGLSVAATVNALIQQATDEARLALLFCGWSAFA